MLTGQTPPERASSSLEPLQFVRTFAPDRCAEDAAIARIVARLSMAYVLRAFRPLIDTFGDARAGLLVQAINAANVAPLVGHQENKRTADGTFPDAARRPISIARLADSSGMPFESTRRIVQRLIEMGVCLRVPGGVIVPRATVQRPSTIRALNANLGYVRRFMRELEVAGLAEPHAPANTRAAPDQARNSVRAVGQLSTDYILRVMRLLVDLYGDVRTGIVVETITAANTSHLDGREGAGWRYSGIDQPAPDDDRTPVSIARLSDSLGVPYQTMREQVGRLIAADHCVRVEGGLIVPLAAMDKLGSNEAMLANVGYARKFVRDLRAAGFDWTVAADAVT
jgi:hypothetical protein